MAANGYSGSPDTIISKFQDATLDLIDKLVLVPLSNHLTNEKKIPMSITELRTICNMPISATPTFPQLMGFPTGQVVNSTSHVAATAPKKGGRAAKSSEGPSCKYVFGKGNKKDEVCGKPGLAADIPYCKICISRATPKDEMHKRGYSDADIENLKQGKKSTPDNGSAPTAVPGLNTIVATKPAISVAAPNLIPDIVARPTLTLIDQVQQLYS